jgi:hypothetical protein
MADDAADKKCRCNLLRCTKLLRAPRKHFPKAAALPCMEDKYIIMLSKVDLFAIVDYLCAN